MSRANAIALSACVVIAPLQGCASGRSFSLAMADPGGSRTVLLVGDGGGVTTSSYSPSAVSSAGGPAFTPVGASAILAAQSSLAQTVVHRSVAIVGPPAVGLPVSPLQVGVSLTTPPSSASSVGTAASMPLVPTSISITANLGSGASAPVTVPGLGGVSVGLTGAIVTFGSGSTAIVSVGLTGVSGDSATAPVSAISPILTNTITVLAEPVQAALADGGASALSAPVPGIVTPTTKALGGLLISAVRKPKHG